MNENRHPKGTPTGGQFAAGAHGEPAVGLNRSAAHTPITATVTLQEWQNDYAVYVGEVSFDAAPILAGMTPEQREAIEDRCEEADELFHEAIARGLVPAHDGPFEVDVREEMDAAVRADPEVFDKARGATQARHADTVLETPLTPYEMGARIDDNNRVSGLSAVDISDLIEDDVDSHLDRIGNDLAGSELLMDQSVTPVSVNSDGSIICRLEGDASAIIDNFDDDELAQFEAGRAAAETERTQ